MLWRFQNTNPSFEILGFVALNSRSHWDVLVTRLGFFVTRLGLSVISLGKPPDIIFIISDVIKH